MTPDYQERTSVFAYKGVIQKIGELSLFFAAAFITLDVFIDPVSGQVDSLKGAQVYSILLGALMMVVGIVMFFALKERYYEKVVQRDQEKVKLLDTLWKALQCKPFVSQLAMALSYGMGTSMVGSLGYYLSVYYVCGGDIALGSKWNFAMGLSNMIMGLFGVPFFAKVTHKKGKKAAMKLCQIMGICAFASSWFLYNPAMPALQLAASGLIAFTQGGFWMIYGSIGADVIDYDEWKSHSRREGVFAACGTYIMKIGLAIGMGLSGIVLATTGFDAGLGAEQSPAALDKIRLIFLGIPIAGLLLAYVFLSKFGLEREDLENIRSELEERRGVV
jgi:GPH family glycoside/pentoside/hexuronide:cation symporter